jgi:hypothetical protein
MERIRLCETKVVNDALMQALGSYGRGKMLFLGLGTGLGSAMIVDGCLVPMELGHLPYRKAKTFEDFVGEAGLKRHGKRNGLGTLTTSSIAWSLPSQTSMPTRHAAVSRRTPARGDASTGVGLLLGRWYQLRAPGKLTWRCRNRLS